jgi:triosephosphate isomerase
MVCIGEQLEHREAGHTFDILKTQLEGFVKSVTDWSNIVIAYEPVWAIGTGKTATPEIAQEVCSFIRSYVKEQVSEEIANALRIQYGGSVNGKNAATLIAQPDVDGFLVGGAALKPDFNEIISAANSLEQRVE